MITRRKFLYIAGLFAVSGANSTLPSSKQAVAQVPLNALQLRLIRDERLVDILGYRKCIFGSLYVVDSLTQTVVKAQEIARTLELPYLNNLSCISAIPEGTYKGKVLEGGALGWRIAFDAVPGRSEIRIHSGNITSQIEGCILIGKSSDPNGNCGCAAPRETDAKGCIKKGDSFNIAEACVGQPIPLSASIKAREDLRAMYGSSKDRPVILRISSGV